MASFGRPAAGSARWRWLGGLGSKAFYKRLYRAYEDHIVGSSAATLSYYFVFSLFPFLFFLATLTAYIPGVRATAETLLARAHSVVPPQGMDVIDAHVRALVATPRPRFLTLGLLATLYSASRGVDAVRKALNLAYDVKESRSLLKTELIAFGMTVGGAVLVLGGISVLILGGDAGFWLARRLHIASAYVELLAGIRWPLTALAVMSCAALGYYFLPDVEQEFRFITPGSVIGTLVWFGAALGFGAYASHFGSYVTYGAIGGVIVLMTWFYLTGFIFLMGGEMNAILEQASPDGKARGARAAGEAPPPPDERPSAVPSGAADSASAAERSRGGLSDSPTGGIPG